MRNTGWIAILALALVAGAPAAADEFVLFTNGKAMRVEKTRRDGKWLYLTLGAEQEMGVLARQVKGVEEAPPAVAGARADSGPANILGIGGGGGGASYSPPPVAEAFESGEVMGEEAGVAAPAAPQGAGSAAPLPGQDLAPRGGRRGGRFPRGN
jgi:hypothetical protein